MDWKKHVWNFVVGIWIGVAFIAVIIGVGSIGGMIYYENKIHETCEVAMNIDDNPTPLARAVCLPRGIRGKLK